MPVATSDMPSPAYFTVQDKGGDNYDVRGYDSRGNLLLHTWHIGKQSTRIECDVWRNRGATERPFRIPEA
jgi:hypothetical protein